MWLPWSQWLCVCFTHLLYFLILLSDHFLMIFLIAGWKNFTKSAPRRWMRMLGACITTRMNLTSAARSRKLSRVRALFPSSPPPESFTPSDLLRNKEKKPANLASWWSPMFIVPREFHFVWVNSVSLSCSSHSLVFLEQSNPCFELDAKLDSTVVLSCCWWWWFFLWLWLTRLRNVLLPLGIQELMALSNPFRNEEQLVGIGI